MALTTTRKACVALVMPLASQQGGAEGLFQHLLRARPNSFRYACLFLQDGPLVTEARALGYETAVLPTTNLSDVRNYIQTVSGIRNWIRRAQVDLVFAWMLKAHLYTGPASLFMSSRRMWFQHGIAKRHWMDVLGSCMPASGIVCCSDFVKHGQDQHLLSSRTIVCYPGVPMPGGETLSRSEARIRLDLNPDEHIICMVARLERWKGAHVFIEAARAVASKFPTARFFVVGGDHPWDTGYAEEVKHLGRSSGLGDRLHLVGQRPAAEIPLWHASADVVVHPVTEPEPFGMAVVEALAARRAVVASRAGGISEIIDDGVSGVLVPPGDSDSLAHAIEELLKDEDFRARIGTAAATRAHMFSVDRFVARFEDAISSVLAA